MARYSTALTAAERCGFRLSNLRNRAFMANIHSQKKRIERALREHDENRRYTSRIKTYFHRLEAAVAEGDAAVIDNEHRTLVRTIDKAVKRGSLHRNNGAHKKSRAARIARGTKAE
jgi:small subunit ribosomal protein S20